MRLSLGLILNLVAALLAVWIALRAAQPRAAAPLEADTPQPASISAARLDLVDAQGRTRATLTLDEAGEPYLALTDGNTLAGWSMRQHRDGVPGLKLTDSKGVCRAVFGGTSLQHRTDAKGEVHTMYGLKLTASGDTHTAEATGPASIVLFNEHRRLLWRAP